MFTCDLLKCYAISPSFVLLRQMNVKGSLKKTYIIILLIDANVHFPIPGW